LTRSRTPAIGRTLWLVLALASWSVAGPSAQTLSIKLGTDELHVKAPGFGFIDGPVFDRLRDGRTTRVDFELAVMSRPKGPVMARDRQSFDVSLDLWEERFAVSRVGPPRRSISHLRASDAEAWCVDALAIPLAALGRKNRDAQFWIRLDYRIADADAPAEATNDGLSLRSLIEVFSRRQPAALTKSLEGGPYRVFDRP